MGRGNDPAADRMIARWAFASMGTLAMIAATPQDIPDLALAPIRFAPHPDDRIGLRRSGLICAPAGKLTWRDVGADGEHLAAFTSKRLRTTGLSIAVADADRFDGDAPRSRMRIVATLDRVAMTACVPWRGLKLISSGAVRGGGRLVVTWRLFDVAQAQFVAKTVSCRDFTIAGAPTVHAAVEQAFGESADVVVPAMMRRVAAGAGDEAPLAPNASACAAGETPSAR